MVARGGDPKVTRRPVRSDPKVRESLRNQVAKALGRPVSTIAFIGHDKGGRPMYRIRYNPGANLPGGQISRYDRSREISNKAWTTKTIVFQNGKVDFNPFPKDKFVPPGPQRPTPAGMTLRDAQDYALSWLARLSEDDISPDNFAELKRQIEGWTGTPERLRLYVDKIWKANLPMGHRKDTTSDDLVEPPGYWDNFDFGGGGGGGGFGGPEYRAPDRRVVEDMAKGLMTSLVGGVLDSRLEAAVNLYMKDHRRDFDSTNAEISPEMSLMEFIRETAEYQQIHALRPETEDERSWISSRISAGEQGGLNVGETQDFGVDQATVGGDMKDMADAAATRQLQVSGNVRGTTLEDRMRRTVTSMFNNVV